MVDKQGFVDAIIMTEATLLNYDNKVNNITVEKSDMPVNILMQVVVPVLYCIISVVGLFGNVVVLTIMWVLVKSKSVTDVYVTNLAIADMLLLMTLPFWAADLIMESWVFGEYMCKIISCMTYLNMYASIYFLTAMSLDRWLAIVKAIKCRSLRTVRNAWITSLSIWGMGLLFIILPALYRTSKKYGPGTEKCIWLFPQASTYTLNVLYNVLRTFLGFLVPLVIIVFCYLDLIRFLQKRSKTKKRSTSVQNRKDKVTKMVLVVITCFVVSWLPNQITNFVHLLKLTGFIDYGCGKLAPKPAPTSSTQYLLNITQQTDVMGMTMYNDNISDVTNLWREAEFPNINSSLPEFVQNISSTAGGGDKSCASHYWTIFYAHLITACLGFSNSMMNPIVYSFMGAVFRKKMCQLFTCSPTGLTRTEQRRTSFWTSTRLATTRTRFSTVVFNRKSTRFNNHQAAEPAVKLSVGQGPQEQECLFPDYIEERLVQLKAARGGGAPVTKRMLRNNASDQLNNKGCRKSEEPLQAITGVGREEDDKEEVSLIQSYDPALENGKMVQVVAEIETKETKVNSQLVEYSSQLNPDGDLV